MTLTPSIAIVHPILNGTWSAQISHPIDAEGRWKYITDEAVIKMPSFNGDQLFRIKQKEKTDTQITATMEPIFMDVSIFTSSLEYDSLLVAIGDAVGSHSLFITVEITIGKKKRHSYFVDTIPIEPEITTYWNRHTWATFAAKIGISMETIGRALGHSIWDNSVTAIYIKYDHSAIDKANRRVIDYLNKDKATQVK